MCVCARTHTSYVRLSLSTFVAVCVLTRALVHLLQFGRPSGGRLCLSVCVSLCVAVMLPGLQYALCLSFTRPVLVNRLQQENCWF